ncbi:TlpA family protein disulfide reductase [Sunxiuqinia elliptica]|uniref:Thiol-disulfide isomerase/thioredoxin n=1 Tax=Sunxiuqinia elliptica TaxID=655355 RepID=A0A4R6GK46_9BACT|nr:TlpA disulfide reductase family protein [Sunxiuqinia elliptica]TDN95373.1 thiol-disulfide isomerase/thioredoxin [Sunxiuqinia elliptica]TDO66868.1 thiol-disulfide isomerase/thioredoxin [Sunxiuqinia elliptica]
MNKTIVILMLALLFSCTKKMDSANNDKLIIAGKIENNQNQSFQIISNEFLRVNSYNVKINDDGTFHTSIPIFHYHDLDLIFDNQSLLLLNKPTDSVYIHILNNDSVIFSGDNSKTNSNLHLLDKKYATLYWGAQFWQKDERFKPLEFLQFVDDFTSKSDSLLVKYSNQINASPDAIKWIQTKLKYKTSDELFEYGLHNMKDIPDVYYNFLEKDSFVENDEAKFCSEYFSDFAMNYISYQLSSNDKYQNIIGLFQQGKSVEAASIYLDLISNKKNNLITQINAAQMLFLSIENYPAQTDSLIQKYNSVFTEEVLKKQLKLSIEEKLHANFKTLEELSKNEEIGELFKKISLENKNKVLYLDFWGTWCGVCINEFPNSAKLHDELKDNNIEFVYLCEPTDSATWINAVQKYNLIGTNILLNKQQKIEIQSLFNIVGIPRYMIVNKNGEIIDENADRPSSSRIKNELIKISKQ